MSEEVPMPEHDDPIAEAKRLLEGVEACFGTLDYRADEQDGAGLYSVVMVESKPRAYALCYATTEESAALIAAAPRLLAALCERLEAAERCPRCGECKPAVLCTRAAIRHSGMRP